MIMTQANASMTSLWLGCHSNNVLLIADSKWTRKLIAVAEHVDRSMHEFILFVGLYHSASENSPTNYAKSEMFEKREEN